MRRKRTFLALLLAGLVASDTALAAASGDASTPFTRYAALEPAVSFWRDVFSKYTQRQIVFHDPYHLDLVYAVHDVSDIIDGGLSDARKHRAIRDRMKAESARLGAVVKRLAHSSPRNAEERRIAAAMAAIDAELPSAATLAGRIRGQRGLGDELCGAVERASVYLPEMREILVRQNVPVGLVSLPLVESSFRSSAHSHAGAVGVWQFTRGTGRRFLHIDHVVDERRDPILATEAAAKYLRENYDRLGTWPLAITAYNHGANGMAYAVRKLGTKDLDTIVAKYQSRYFGFASRNFYAEFLAAHEVMSRAADICGELPAAPPASDRFVLDTYVPLADLARCANVDTAELMRINPGLQADVGTGKLYVPKGYRLNIPAGSRAAFNESYAALPAVSRFSGQPPYYASHRVGVGQTLSGIAKTYRTSVAQLMYHNDIRDPRRLRSGQTIRVPVAGAAAATMARATIEGGELVHRVSRGQTLSHIAKHYRVSVAALQRHNEISDPRKLLLGQAVKIPSADTATAAVGGYHTHRVGKGQTLSHIARLYRTTVSVLQRHNGIRDPRKLRYGQIIKIPM